MAFQFLRIFFVSLPLVASHAWLKEPMCRNGPGSSTSCPHCGQGDGPNTVKSRNPNWPTHQAYGGHGLCGDPFQGTAVTAYADEVFLNAETPAQATYSAGQMVKFQVYISTHHNGHFSFRLCDQVINPTNFQNAQEGQNCLDQHVLQRVDPAEAYGGNCVANDPNPDCQPLDPKHPERWYLPPKTGAANVMEMYYWLPEGVTCEKCTLQWYWSTGNTCLYDADYVDYFGAGGTFQSAGWNNANSWSQFGAASWGKNQVCGSVFAEEFWNCADIKIESGGGGGARRRAPAPVPSPVPVPTPTGGGGSSGGSSGGGSSGGFAGLCRSKCGDKTGPWKSDFTEFEGNNNFCGCGFGGSCGFICGGGMDGSSGGTCPAEACTSGQYSFTDNTWTIEVKKSQAAAKVPYRAFAYLPVCNGPQTSTCAGDDFTLAFSFRTNGLLGWGAYVKLLFWTDGGNLVGLLPPNAANGNNKLRLITFMQDDYPNNWKDEVEIKDNTWYSVKVHFNKGSVTIDVAGTGLTSTEPSFPVNVWGESNGPQLGVYHFDFGGSYTSDKLVMDLAALSGPGGNIDRHDCEHGCLASAVPSPPTPRPRPTPTPTPVPTPTPTSSGSCQGCLDASTDWKETCAHATCAGCSGCPQQTQCAQWCDRAPVDWSEKCDWMYCAACSGCGPTPSPPPPTPPAPTPTPGGGFCCTWSASQSCGDCDDHNRQMPGTGNWCAEKANCATCNGFWCD